jgi:hypothetical protein
MSQDITSKDEFFAQLARISDEMIAAYDKDFAMGALVLAARFIAEGQKRDGNPAQADNSANSVKSPVH